ncbi:MAG: hypothetical protein HYY26_01325 [Acidobacteria bacterium]|nr:hypothetical protein [Acidobacteriota bacterium]
MEAKDALEMVRESILKRLPEMADAEITVKTEVFALPARSVSKAASVLGVEYARPLRTHAVRMRKVLKAEDGASVPRIVHAFVDDDGRIRKMVVSR